MCLIRKSQDHPSDPYEVFESFHLVLSLPFTYYFIYSSWEKHNNFMSIIIIIIYIQKTILLSFVYSSWGKHNNFMSTSSCPFFLT